MAAAAGVEQFDLLNQVWTVEPQIAKIFPGIIFIAIFLTKLFSQIICTPGAGRSVRSEVNIVLRTSRRAERSCIGKKESKQVYF